LGRLRWPASPTVYNIAVSIRFEWDLAKDTRNVKKLDVTFDEASTAFADPLSLTIRDPAHSMGEERFVLLGQSLRGRLLVVAHTEKGDSIRLISARAANRIERRTYEESR
jgi:hypothetical protein